MNADNPIFDFIEEGMPADSILESMGFEFLIVSAMGFDFSDADDANEADEAAYQKFLDNADAWINAWNPTVDDDEYVLCQKYAAEDGPQSLFVKPVTEFAKLLLAFGFSEAAQKASANDLFFGRQQMIRRLLKIPAARMKHRDAFFYDGFVASMLFPVGSEWYMLEAIGGNEAGQEFTVTAVYDGTRGGEDDTRIETTIGSYSITVAQLNFRLLE